MAIIKRCKRCNKLLFFKSKLYMDNHYCEKCVVTVRAIEEENKKLEHSKRIAEKKLQLKKAGIRNNIADKKLIEDLEIEKKKTTTKKSEKSRKTKA